MHFSSQPSPKHRRDGGLNLGILQPSPLSILFSPKIQKFENTICDYKRPLSTFLILILTLLVLSIVSTMRLAGPTNENRPKRKFEILFILRLQFLAQHLFLSHQVLNSSFNLCLLGQNSGPLCPCRQLAVFEVHSIPPLALPIHTLPSA